MSEPVQPRLILASASPRRHALLNSLGLRFERRPVDIDETPRLNEAPVDYVSRLAMEKAREDARAGELILAADTIVVLDGEMLGKPADAVEARSMLSRLAGRQHEVLTGVALFETDDGRLIGGVERSRVRIARLSEEIIAWYVATGEPLDKAGSYAIQDRGALFVESIEGNYTNVVGLPLPLVLNLFNEMGLDLLGRLEARGSKSETRDSGLGTRD